MKIGECVRLGVMRKAIIGIFKEKNVLWSYLSFRKFKVFLEHIQLFYLSTNCHNFLLFFSCCSPELEAVGILKKSLSVFQKCQKEIFGKLFLTSLLKTVGFFGLKIL